MCEFKQYLHNYVRHSFSQFATTKYTTKFNITNISNFCTTNLGNKVG